MHSQNEGLGYSGFVDKLPCPRARILHTHERAELPFASRKFRFVLVSRTNANGFFPVSLGKLVPQVRIELTTYPLPSDRSLRLV